MAKPTIPGLFHTRNGTPIQALYRVGGEKLVSIMVKAYPEDNGKSFITHIDLGVFNEPAEEVMAYLESLGDKKVEKSS